MERSWDGDPMLNALEQIMRTLGEQPAQSLAQTDPHMESSPPARLVLPANIHELIDTGLEQVDMGGLNTKKYRVRGHPELLVRLNEGLTRAEQTIAYRAARAMGLNPVPADFVTHDEETYVFTSMVTGKPLEEALVEDRTPEIIEAADRIFSTIATGMVTAHRFGIDWPSDAQTPNQYMWGTIPGDTQPRAWLVDLPGTSYVLDGPDEYGMELFNDIGGLLQAEQAAGQQLPAARQAFSEAIVRCPDSLRYGDGIRRASAHCLVNGINPFELPGDEYDFIDDFRTY